MNCEKVFAEIGGFNRYQAWIFLFICLIQMNQTFSNMELVFITALPHSFYCQYANGTRRIVSNCLDEHCQSYSLIEKHEFYSLSFEQRAMCNARARWESEAIFSTYMFGLLIGAVFYGPRADSLGRFYTYVESVCGQIACAFCSIWLARRQQQQQQQEKLHHLHGDGDGEHDWSVFHLHLLSKFLQAVFTQGFGIVSFTILVEFTSRRYRAVCGLAIQAFYALGVVALGAAARLTAHWHTLALCSALFTLVFVLPLAILQESPRWLLALHRFDEAKQVFCFVNKFNTWNRLPHIVLVDKFRLVTDEIGSRNNIPVDKSFFYSGLLNVFTHSNYFAFSTLISVVWFCLSTVYYGMTMISSRMSHISNAYVSFSLSGISELPAYILLYFFIKRFELKLTLACSLIFSGLFCFAFTAQIDSHFEWPKFLSMSFIALSKLLVSMSFAVSNVITSDAYPSHLRNSALGVSSISSQLGAFASSYMFYWNQESAIMTFGIMALCAGLLVLRFLQIPNPILATNKIDCGI